MALKKKSGENDMSLKIIRALFVIACLIMGGIWAKYIVETSGQTPPETGTQFSWIALGAIVGGAMSGIVLILLMFVSQDAYERLSPALMAIVMAMVIGYFLGQYILWWWPDADVTIRVYVIATLVLLFGFMGVSLGLTRAANWESFMNAMNKRPLQRGGPKIIDTSVIIDGRIADIWKSGFVEGTLIIPRFVLKELQRIADSADVLRRAKGRRGLDILKSMQESKGKVNLTIVDDDYPEIQEVDGKLVRIAKTYGAKIVTNDYNLNKVAQIEGVDVLNINDLANALKPAVLPDEEMEVKIVKEGKEVYQGVGYLDDGTMVVVDGGKDYVGKTVAAVVTSVLQTAAGRMIFTKMSRVIS